MSSKREAAPTKPDGRPALVPKLRFPEFRETEDWKPITLEEASTPVTELVGERKLTPFSISAGIGFVPQAEKFGRDISGNQYQVYTLVRDGDFVFNKGNSLKFPQGCVYLLLGWGQVAAPNVFICFRLKKGYSNGFFQQCFEQNQHGRELKRHITSGARSNGLLNISKETFFGVEIPTPSPAEQQKIAECLSSVDELMAAQARKVDALKTHKKGLMQQLFPREGETQPRLRFPEFQNVGGWVVKPLGEVFQITSSKRVHESDWTPTGVPFYRAREIVALSKREPIQPLFISEELYAAYCKQTGEIREGHLLVTGVGSIGVPYLVKAGDRFYFKDGNIIWLKNEGRELSGEFLHRLYETDYVQKQLKAMADVGTVATYTIDNAKRTLAAFPKDKREQQRIATCLSSLDALITAETQKHEALKTHKKGLMQQLFPSPEEG